MIHVWGEIALFCALGFSFLQSVIPLWGHWRRNPYALSCARVSAYGQCVFVLLAYALLTLAFATNDFSLAYVAANSHPLLPLMYRLTAVWGGHEGSILLWALMLNAWAMAFLFLARDDFVLQPLSLAILGLISVCFLGFLLLTSDPFALAPPFMAGQDLNPLLQDMGFTVHPPMLYAGYVGSSLAFAITQAALIRGELDRQWVQMTQWFALAAWCFLTLGITLGSWWAYRVLGWGGFWFWDPVENASLLPWLSGVALIHVLVLCEKRNAAKAWAALLALISFALSVLGTFLVRSGVLVSVHTFANDPQRGVFLLLVFVVLVASAWALYVVRFSKISAGSPLAFPLLSREAMLLVNSALLMLAMSTVLLATLYPLLLDALQLTSVSVGAPYFNHVMLPLALIMMAFMGAGAICSWQSSSLHAWWQSAWKKMAISLIAAVVLLWTITGQFDGVAIFSLSLSLWVLLGLANHKPLLSGMSLAHTGFAILVIGVVLSGLLTQESDVRIRPGNETTLGPYQFYFMNTKGVLGQNYRAIQAEFTVFKHGRRITQLLPEKRIYPVRDMVMTKVAIHPGIFRDLYIALGQPLDHDYWSVRFYYKPFVRWIWFGGAVMVLGGGLALLRRATTRRSPKIAAL